MKLLPINRGMVFTIAGRVIFALLLALIADWSIGSIIENVKIVRLKNQALTGVVNQKVKFQNLRQEVETMKNDINVKKGLRYPTLADLKTMTGKYHLNIYSIEKSAHSIQEKKEARKYTTTFLGQMSGLVKFIQEIEKSYLFEAEQLLLRPADENGETVSLSMSLYISEP